VPLDLSSCDNALWGFVNQKVAQKQYRSSEELPEAVRNMFATIAPAVLLLFLIRKMPENSPKCKLFPVQEKLDVINTCDAT
jgi:hypothetical protein